MRLLTSFSTLLSVILLFGFLQTSRAQSSWLYHQYSSSIGVEWFKPVFNPPGLDHNDKISFFSSVLFLRTRHQVTNRLWLLGDVPISHWEFKDKDGIDRQAPHTAIGNIYVGGEYHYWEDPDFLSSFIEFGVRLPTMAEPDFPDQRGYFTGYYSAKERRGAFADAYLPLTGLGNLLYRVNKIVKLRLRGGLSYWIHTGDINRDNRIYLAQSIQAHFQTKELSGHFGISGRYNIDIDDKTTQLRAGLSKAFNDWTGGLYLRRPLSSDSYVRVYGIVVNINM